ncbi:MAG: reprolysin-like metallopeptidase [Lewinella sp.]|uniref:reprolysin-like metallopeptidase n=1 Tax=Lewinella sp. TaxID=2004506 RepID=UPI003D6AF5D2
MKRSILFLLLGVFSFTAGWSQADPGMWTNRQVAQLDLASGATMQTFATNYRLVELASGTLASHLLATDKSVRQVALPTPDGKTLAMSIRPVSVMAPGLAARYPGIQTYEVLPALAEGILGGRVGWTYQGLHATIRTTEGTIYIDPYALNDDRYYVSYFVEENLNTELWNGFECNASGETGLDIEEIYASPEVITQQDKTTTGGPSIVQRRYRLAMACTGEFSNFHGGTVETSMSAIVTIINRVNEVFGRDMAIQLELIENNDQLIFLDPSTDPYENQTDEMLNDNPGVLDGIVGNAAYDIGHVISTGPFSGQGVAQLQGVCRANGKGRATSTRSSPQGDPFVINILCHEMGHQFGATHVQSGCQNVSVGTAVEPGGGTTIMGYAGICPSGYNIASNSSDYYNQTSLQQIFAYTRDDDGNACATPIAEGNTIPEVTVDYENGFFIPISTPFELTASATDMENDDLTYCWEQRNTNLSYPYDEEAGDYGPFPGSPVGDSPLFRSFSPTSSPTRVFPLLTKIINNTSDNAEVLPTYSRNMTFRCAVRDNHPTSGGVAWAGVAFRAAVEAGPFLVTSPNTASAQWNVGDYTEVTWDVANTDGDIVNCQRVNIRLSTDGGLTYPIMLLADTPNDGTAFVTVPDAVSNDARVRIDAADNIFFDISNQDFSIEPAVEAGYTLNYGPLYQEICVPESTADIEFITASILDYDSTITLDITSTLPDNVVANFTATELQPGEGSSLTLDFSNSTFDGSLTVEVRAVTTDEDTTYRVFNVEVYNNDFSALELLTPAEGSSGIVLSADFSWTGLPNAQLYDFELATSPLFGDDIIDEASGLETTAYTPTILFEENTLFFWRIRPINECGAGPWSSPYTFHTENATCEGQTSTDTPLNIPGQGPLPTITSTINVDFQGTISDINIPILNVRYQPIQNFQIILRSPQLTEVLLYDGECFSTDRVNVGFDDDAPQTIQCPPTSQSSYIPTEALAAFIGEESQGEWKLIVKITETGFGSPGSVDEWAIEFCASSSPDAPIVVRNEEFCVKPNESGNITGVFLAVEDDSQNAFELEYTVVSEPTAGELYFLDQQLFVGDIFRQSSLDAGNVYYVNTDNSVTEDNFTFVVQDGTGGFLPVTTFTIDILDACVTSNENLAAAEAFRLYPNPTKGQVVLQWSEATTQDYRLLVYNLQAQLLQQAQVANGTLQHNLDLSTLPAGIYLIQIGQHVERVVVE